MLLGLIRVSFLEVILPEVLLPPSFLRNPCFELSGHPLVSFALTSLHVACIAGKRLALLLKRRDPCIRGVDEDQMTMQFGPAAIPIREVDRRRQAIELQNIQRIYAVVLLQCKHPLANADGVLQLTPAPVALDAIGGDHE